MDSKKHISKAAGLRLAGALLVGGMLAEVLATAFHPAHQDPNNHVAVFAEYARESGWIAEHIAQFAAGLVIFGGLAVLFRVLCHAEPKSVLPWVAAGAATSAAAAFAALQAIDGVALKHAVDAWAAAPAAERAGAFADAELVRSLEWGANAFFRLLQGATLVLFAGATARMSLTPRWLSWVGLAGGGAYVVTGAVVAADGFSRTSLTLSFAADPLFLMFALGLLVTGVRGIRRAPDRRATIGGRSPEPVR
jgi:Domain of unknown function (DUF4386)